MEDGLKFIKYLKEKLKCITDLKKRTQFGKYVVLKSRCPRWWNCAGHLCQICSVSPFLVMVISNDHTKFDSNMKSQKSFSSSIICFVLICKLGGKKHYFYWDRGHHPSCLGRWLMPFSTNSSAGLTVHK